MVQGNIQGVRRSLLDELEKLTELELPGDEFAPLPLIETLARFTGQTGREVSVYLRRDAKVVSIEVGDAFTVALEDMHLRRNRGRLAGVRCIHTHPGGDAVLSDVDLQSLKTLRLDAMAAVGVKEEGRASALSCAFIEPEAESGYSFHGPYGIYQIPQQELLVEINELDARVDGLPEPERTHERVLLAGIAAGPTVPSLLELKNLAKTAGAEIAGIVWQNMRSPDNATYFGAGKAKEISLEMQALDCDLLIVDDEMTGAQTRNLEAIVGRRVIDRAALILDIFAQHATSREGKLQVELAQLQYRLPRLIGVGTEMSRLGAGIGTRGPGETKLEIDRRRIRERITDIKREIGRLREQRAMRRQRRERNRVPVVALVGYTNAGKSTLLNHLTQAGVLAEDKLFATLDTTTRSLELPGGMECLVTDTVGFIDKLPHDLVSAFRSTLEEAMYADLLVIVSDASSPDAARQQSVVDEVLVSLGAGDKPRVYAMNKSDREVGDPSHTLQGSINISAKKGQNIEELLLAVERQLSVLRRPVEFLIPYDKGNVLAYLHGAGAVESENYEEEGTRVTAMLEEPEERKVLAMLR